MGCGGTEALIAGKGYEVYHVIATSGEAGSLTRYLNLLMISFRATSMSDLIA